MNSLGSNKEIAENKLILLYLIDRLNVPVSNLQITKLVLENKLMNYFLQQQFLNELIEGKFLEQEASGDKALYRITQSGRKSLGYFLGMIPPGIKRGIDSSIPSMRKNIRNETLISADYTPEGKKDFIVNCKVCEDSFPLMEINLTVGTKEDAKAVCRNWKSHTQDIYAEIINIFTKQRDGENP